MNILNKLKDLNLTPNEYVVVGAGILEVLGIRDTNDIDIAVTKSLFNKLQQTGDYEEIEKYGKIFLKREGVDVIPQLDWDKYKTTTEEAIASAVVIEGFCFMNLDELCKFKTALGREKDFEDVELIRNYQKEMNKPKIQIFESLIKKSVINFKTGEKYEIQGGESMFFSDKDFDKIAKICSQENTYDMLFRKRFEGRSYTKEDAEKFVEWIKDGWKKQAYFVFFIRNVDSEIVGSMDIKNTNFEGGEIGYWADENYSGFMTNSVKELLNLAKQVGFTKLFAGVKAVNNRSMGVLERNGFEKTKEEIKDGEDYLEYWKSL